MYCPNCGKEIDEMNSYCMYCGKNIRRQQKDDTKKKAVSSNYKYVLLAIAVFTCVIVGLVLFSMLIKNAKKKDVVADNQTEQPRATETEREENIGEQEDTKATSEETGQFDELYKFYAECLKNYRAIDEYENSCFLLCDLNYNGIPELYIGDGFFEHEGCFVVKEMFVDNEKKVEVSEPMKMLDGYFSSNMFSEIDEYIDETDVIYYQLMENDCLEEVLKYSISSTMVGPGLYEDEYYIWEDDGNKSTVEEKQLPIPEGSNQSIYTANKVSDDNIMTLESGELQWNKQPESSDYTVCNGSKFMYGIYKGELAVTEPDGTIPVNYLWLNADGTFVLRKEIDFSDNDIKMTGTYSFDNRAVILNYDSSDYFKEFYITAIEGNKEVFMIGDSGFFYDQWHGYNYIGKYDGF